MDPFSYFDGLYLINLDKREDRLAESMLEFERVGIASRVERFSAVLNPMRPHWGCVRSHQLVIAKALMEEKKRILIFEDDIEFVDFSVPRFQCAVDSLMRLPEWELFYLGGRAYSHTKKVGPHIVEGEFLSTHAYAVNLEMFRAVPIIEPPIDRWYASHLRAVCAYPIMASQRDSYSDLAKRRVDWKRKDFIKSMYLSRVLPTSIMRLIPEVTRGDWRTIPILRYFQPLRVWALKRLARR